MLVLSRKRNESIRIADNIEVTVLEIRGNRVRLGISAPQSVNVRRSFGEIEIESACLASEHRTNFPQRQRMTTRELTTRVS